MTNLFDMLNQMTMQGGASSQPSMAEQMARQFGLQQEQAQKAMEALMPAFSQGLKRNASTPQGFAGFMQALASGNHAEYMQNPMKAFSPEGMNEGNAILGHLFGSKEVSRAVAAQAEAASGVSQAVLKQMLPALAPMLMGGLFKQMTGQAAQPQAQNFGGMGGGGGILGQILEQMMRGQPGFPQGGGTGGGRASPQARNPLEEIMEQMMGGRRPSGQSQAPSNPGGPLGDIFNEMIRKGPMGGFGSDPYGGGSNSEEGDRSPQNPGGMPDFNDMFGRQRQETQAEPEEEAQSPYPKGTGLEDLFGDLFKPAREVSKQYEKGVQDIFDQFLPKK